MVQGLSHIFQYLCPPMKTTILALLGLLVAISAHASDGDSTRLHRFGVELSGMSGSVIAADSYEKKWLKGKRSAAFGVALRYASLPQDSDAYAEDFGHPVLIGGLKYGLNHGVTMHREQDPDWGQLVPVDYTSRMGNILTLYAAFERPLLRTRRWQADYTFSFGTGWSRSKYNTRDAIDNELIGSRWLIYFGAALHATYHFSADWGLRAGIEFYHHSNGALNRPNKGANVVAPSLAVVYEPFYESLVRARRQDRHQPFRRFSFVEVALGLGGKTLNEDWQLTQFQTAPSDPSYRTSHFRVYPTYSLQLSFLRRYARRWASGAGVDLFYGPYASRVEDIDLQQGHQLKHSPWSVGVAARHRVYYHHLSLDMSLGYYLYRHMGDNARLVETPYYERIGLHYSFPSLHHLTIGIDVKAHKTKADYTEIVVSYPFSM